MTEELQKKLVEIITKAQEVGHDAFIFTKEQVPDVLHQLVVYHLASKVFWSLLGLVLLAPFFFLMRYVIKHNKDEEPWGLLLGFSFLLAVAGALSFLWNVDDVLKIWLAPKVFLLEYARDFIRK